MAERNLAGKRVAMLLTDGVEQVEYTGPRTCLEARGATVHLVAPKESGDRIQGFEHLTPGGTFIVEVDAADASAEDYDLLVLPGGVANPDLLRLSHEAVALVRGFAEADKPIAAICHGPWLLINAGIAQGRRLTSFPSLRTDLVNAGAEWVDEAVVVDGKVITSRGPKDLPPFEDAIVRFLQST